MCPRCTDATITPPPLARRRLLQLAAVTAAAAAGPASSALAATKAPPKPHNALAPDAALERLMRGNARYVAGANKRHDFRREREALSTGQNPFAAVLGCADSRVTPEFCFDTGRGDLFVCRVAGNFATDAIIASFEYAVTVLKTPLIMVLGHDSCGAVEATLKSVGDGTTLPGHLPALVAAIRPAVEGAKGDGGEALADAIRRNVLLNVEKLKAATPILKAAVDDKTIAVVGGVYKLASGRVELVG
jgi:carbonic anhydrase